VRAVVILAVTVMLITIAGYIVTELLVPDSSEGSLEARLAGFGSVCIDVPLARPFIQKIGVVSSTPSSAIRDSTIDGRIAAYTLYAIPLIGADVRGASSSGFESCSVVRL